MRTVFTFVLLFTASYSVADPQPWMKQENPNELAISIAISSDCPFVNKMAKSIVEGVLTRSRIKGKR